MRPPHTFSPSTRGILVQNHFHPLSTWRLGVASGLPSNSPLLYPTRALPVWLSPFPVPRRSPRPISLGGGIAGLTSVIYMARNGGNEVQTTALCSSEPLAHLRPRPRPASPLALFMQILLYLLTVEAWTCQPPLHTTSHPAATTTLIWAANNAARVAGRGSLQSKVDLGLCTFMGACTTAALMNSK